MSKRSFPKDFFWGASTAAHQVEGSNHNQWTVWELENAARLAKTAEARLAHWLPAWERFKKQAQDPENYVSGEGVSHYELYKHDLAIAKRLNLNAFRFGVEWSRLEPEEGVWDKSAWDHYKAYIAELKANRMEPFLNIWHWTVPVWFAEKGGFVKKSNLKYFDRFVAKIAEELGDEISYAITINEPNVYASFGYITAEWPPQDKNWLSFLRAYYNLATAHKRAYKILKKFKPGMQIGIAQQLANIQAKRPHNLIDQIMTKWMRYFWNWWFFIRIKKFQDFVGFNYYYTDYYAHIKRDNPKLPTNDMGSYMEPEGLYELLLRTWVRYKKPIIITENGVADEADEFRQWWLQETILAMERALSEGVDLRGYFYWSLLDNFEWSFGWWPKFGLVAVDRNNGMKRTVRPSAKWMAEYIEREQQGLDDFPSS